MKNFEKDNFVKNNLIHHKDSNEKVLNFIADFIYYQPNNKNLIYNQFRAGYCYHFAQILKNTFNRGEICWAAPFGHILWQDDDKICYDIEGVYSGEADFIIPIGYIEDGIKDFLRIPAEGFSATQEDINRYIRNYLIDNPDKLTPEYEHIITKEEIEEHKKYIDKLIEECREIESKNGYYLHKVINNLALISFPPNNAPTISSIHTHGLLRNFTHLELEVVCSKETEKLMEKVITTVADSIRDFSVNLKKTETKVTIDDKKNKNDSHDNTRYFC